MKRFFAAIAIAAALPAVAFAFTTPGNPTGYVNDFAHVLQQTTVQQLDAELSAFEASTSNQIAVVIVPDMGGDYVEHYAEQLFQAWGIGQKAKDNGVLLLVSMQEHAIRIEVGYGLEGALPDSVAQRIINNDVSPNFKAQKYDQGVANAVRDIELATQNEYTAPTEDSFGFKHLSDFPWEQVSYLLFFFIPWLGAIFARSRSWLAGGVVGGVLGIFGWVVFALALVPGLSVVGALIALGLLFDYIVSKTYANSKQNGTRPPWWIGGGGFSSGRGGGFGGFGGGSSGGGGASGSW